jgi:hypothetical protein
MENSLAMVTSDITKHLLVFVLLFGVCMVVAAVNIVHFHHRRSRWQEALAAFAGAASLLLFGLYLVGYGLDVLQVLFQLSSASPDITGAFTSHSLLVYSTMIALAGAMVCAFSGALAVSNILRHTAQPVFRTAHA